MLVQGGSRALRELREARERLVELTARGPDFNDPLLQAEVLRVRELESRSHAPKTLKEYEKAFRLFETWCAGRGYSALPASVDAVRLFLKDSTYGPTARTEHGKLPRSIGVLTAAIAFEHNVHGLTSPTQSPRIKKILKGIRNEKGLAPRQKDPVETTLLVKLLRTIDADVANFEPRCGGEYADETAAKRAAKRSRGGPEKQLRSCQLRGKRDRALFLVAFGGSFRREELTGLNLEDVRFVDKGLVVHLRRSKGDQEGQGATVAIPYGKGRVCPVRALREWIEVANINYGVLFPSVSQWGEVGARLSGGDLARILKKRAGQLGIPADRLAGHSFRAGFATSAYKAGKPLPAISGHMRHRKLDTTRGYIRNLEAFENNPVEGLFGGK